MPSAAGVNWYPFKVTDDQWKATFSLAATCAITERFPTTPQTLHAFLTFLERNSQVEVSMPNHSIKREVLQVAKEGQGSWAYKIEEEKTCVHRISQTFSSTARGVKPVWKNVGALVDAAKARESKNIQAYVKIECPNRL